MIVYLLSCLWSCFANVLTFWSRLVIVEFPNVVIHLPFIEDFRLSHNQINGTIPTELSYLSSLSKFQLEAKYMMIMYLHWHRASCACDNASLTSQSRLVVIYCVYCRLPNAILIHFQHTLNWMITSLLDPFLLSLAIWATFVSFSFMQSRMSV